MSSCVAFDPTEVIHIKWSAAPVWAETPTRSSLFVSTGGERFTANNVELKVKRSSLC